MLIRFLSVSILAFLLISPFFQSNKSTIEKPIVIVAQDNSESIVQNKDSSFYKHTYPKEFARLIEKLQSKFTIKTISFDSKCSDTLVWNFKGKATDYSSLFQHITDNYANQNIGAVVVATDGIYNKGTDPNYSSHDKNIKAPIYTIALGDTLPPKDISITSVKHNQIAFEGNDIPVEIQVRADHLNNNTAKLVITEKDDVLQTQTLKFSKEKYFMPIHIMLKATKAGIHHYKIDVQHLKDELTYKNNSKDFVIEVLKSKQKILIVYNAPNPDIGAIKRSLESNSNYEVEVALPEKLPANIIDYNLVILYQIPSTTNAGTQILQAIFHEKIPAWFIFGSQADFQKVNTLFPGLIANSRSNAIDEAQMTINPAFSLFEVDETMRSFIEQCPPLYIPYVEYKSSNTNAFSFQKINGIETNRPLQLFFSKDENKIAVTTGEGLWRWRLVDYRLHNDSKLFDEFISKIVTYTAIKDKKTKFRVTAERMYHEDESVVIGAELYNDSYELTNSPEIQIEVRNSKDRKYSFAFSKTEKTYTLDAGVFPQGDYTYKAVTKIENKSVAAEGAFSVIPVNIESEDIIARHSDLNSLSKNHGGKMFYPQNIDKLADEILNNEDIKAISHFEKTLKAIIDFPLFFFLILGLVSLEWFFRKYYGGY